MSDREEFQAARDAGLAIRQQRRIETREELRRRTRREVAEEIAEAIERFFPDPHDIDKDDCSECELVDYLARLAREIGTR